MTAQEARERMPSNVGCQEKVLKVLEDIYYYIERALQHNEYSITYAIEEELVHIAQEELCENGFNCTIQLYADHSASLIKINWRKINEN